jgi:serine/threonine protein kinase
MVGEDFAGYRLRAVLGRGGMSVVYEAEHARLGSTIALKVLAPELSSDDVFRARFLKESRIAASLNHPNVIPIYDTGPSDELLYIAMRYVAGSDLRTVLRQRERISPGQALLLIGQAGRALDAAHRNGLVHRDVKPANVLIERGADEDPDHVYLADFGITKHTLSRSGLTATGQFVGTIDYIAPEQIQDKTIDGRADIYSLGCVMYECLTGRVPFVKDVEAAVIWAHVEELPAPPSTVTAELPTAIDAVIARALAKDPEDRFASCREFMLAAHDALQPLVPRTEPTTTVPGAGPPTVLSGLAAAGPTTPAQQTARRTSASQEAATGAPAEAPPPAPAPQTRQSPSETVLGSLAGAGAGTAASAQQTSTSPPETVPVDAHRLSGEEHGAPPSGRRRLSTPLLAGAAVVVLLAAAGIVLAVTSGGGSSSAPPGELRSAALVPVPSNNVTGTGSATLRLNGNMAVVTLKAIGLVNNVHLMHIHAGPPGRGLCPPASAAKLHNGHLAIDTKDGIPYYGPPAASLTTSGDASAQSFLSFNRFPSGSDINYKRVIPLAASVVELIRANNAVVVVHGIDYNGSGQYSNVLSASDLLPEYPATQTAPALCGPLTAAGSTARTGRGKAGGELYVAQLIVDTSTTAWWCESETGVATWTDRPRSAPGDRRGGATATA